VSQGTEQLISKPFVQPL